MSVFTSSVSPEGRIVIPAQLRRALSLNPGDTVTFRLEDDHAVMTSRAAALSRLQSMFSQVHENDGQLLSDQLIAERRTEAARDESAR